MTFLFFGMSFFVVLSPLFIIKCFFIAILDFIGKFVTS